jgi:hypothetical protein
MKLEGFLRIGGLLLNSIQKIVFQHICVENKSRMGRIGRKKIPIDSYILPPRLRRI